MTQTYVELQGKQPLKLQGDADAWHLIHELAKALTPQPNCGHPPGCVVSVSYIEDVAESSSCGWCAAQAENRRLVENGAMATAVWAREHDNLYRQMVEATSERDDLRETLRDADADKHKLAIATDEKLAEAKNIADRCISALDDILEHVPTGYVTTEIENTFTVSLAWRAAND